MRANILELHREFLPPTQSSAVEFDSVGFTASVNGWKYLPKGEDVEKIQFNWSANFLIRIGNTTICLHEVDGDERLFKMEEKLKLLRDNLLFLVKEIKARIKTDADDTIVKREWLNAPENDNAYTGYFSYTIHPNGSSRLFIADCHRSLDINLFVFKNRGKTVATKHYHNFTNNETKEQLNKLKHLAGALGHCIRSIHTLRKRFNAGEIEKKLLENNAPKQSTG